MNRIKKKDIEEIRREVEEEFPNDPALQQVHIARKIISKEAEIGGLSLFEYIKSLRKPAQDIYQKDNK